MAVRDPNQTYTYKIFGRNVTLPKGFQLAPGVSINQNKKSVEEGFKKLEKWLKNPTPQNWNKIFGKNNTFGLQLRAYLLDEPIDLRKGTGLKETSKKVFDAINVKKLLTESQINKINELTTGGKGKSLKSIAARTFGNLKFTMDEVIETIKNFQNGEQWLRRNPDQTAVDTDGKIENMLTLLRAWRKKNQNLVVFHLVIIVKRKCGLIYTEHLTEEIG